MFKIRFVAFAAAVLAALAVSSPAQQPAAAGGIVPDGKVVVLNTQVFQTNINELKQKYEQVENQFKDRSQKLQTAQQQLTQMENDIRTKGSVLPADQLQKMQSDYEDLKRRSQREYEDLKAEYERTVETATRPIREKLLKFLDTYAAQRGFVMIVNLAGAAQTGSLAYWNPGIDITEDFVKEYNKANPIPGATTPAAPAAKPAPGKPGSN